MNSIKRLELHIGAALKELNEARESYRRGLKHGQHQRERGLDIGYGSYEWENAGMYWREGYMEGYMGKRTGEDQ